ncbi:MAG: hypothetical protein IKQ55_09265 [Kiritimatiellae bacterium]|nr:hypothetical protein [Kiritimatiellia bacterium]
MNPVDFLEARVAAVRARLTPGRFYPLLLAALVLAGLAVFLLPGIASGNDMYYHFTRIHTMCQDFRLGEIPAMVNHGAISNYGYATGLFYPDVFLYPWAFLVLCGMGIVAAYKCFVAAWMLLTAFSAYFCARKLSATHFGAFAAALLYSWSSYLATDLFPRAALGEFLVFAFMPWILWGLHEILFGDPRRFWWFSFGFAGVVCSHGLSLIILSFLCGAIVAFNFLRLLREPRRLLYLALSPLPVLLVGAAVLAPSAEQFAHFEFLIKGEKNADFLARCMPALKLFLEIPTCELEIWHPSGVGTIFLILLLLRGKLVSKRTPAERYRDILLIAGVSCLALSTSMPPWKEVLQPLIIVQFPWRFFAPATAFLAFGGGLVLSTHVGSDWKRERYWLVVVVMGSASMWFANVGYTYGSSLRAGGLVRGYAPGRPQEASGIHYLPLGSILDLEIRERGDVATPSHPLDCTVTRPQINVLELAFSGNAADNEVELPLLPYWGYRARLTAPGGAERELAIGQGPNKFLSVKIPADCPSGTVSVRYEATRIQRASQACSLLSSAAWLAFALRARSRRKKAAA